MNDTMLKGNEQVSSCLKVQVQLGIHFESSVLAQTVLGHDEIPYFVKIV